MLVEVFRAQAKGLREGPLIGDDTVVGLFFCHQTDDAMNFGAPQ
jgi:hypothetical protein